MSETTTHRRTRQLKGQLTDLKLRNLETREKPYKVADGNGLFVLVSPSGLRAWRWKYRFAGKEKVLPLGKYPDVTLGREMLLPPKPRYRSRIRLGATVHVSTTQSAHWPTVSIALFREPLPVGFNTDPRRVPADHHQEQVGES